MRKAAPEMKVTKNFHNKIGYVAFYIKALNSNNLSKNAENYADTFLKAYEEVLRFRWHLFFSVYLETLLFRKNHMKLLNLARKYKLPEKDKIYQARANYLPVIPWLIGLANYRSELITKKELILTLKESTEQLSDAQKSLPSFKNLVEDFKVFIPEITNLLIV